MKKSTLFFVLIIGIFISLSSCNKDSDEITVNHNGIEYDLITGFNSDNTMFLDKRDFKAYSVVNIKNQIWMGENLHYASEESIFTTGQRRYSHESALTACPRGWHLPSLYELRELALGAGDGNLSIAGTALKSSQGWNGTNTTGFNALSSSYGFWSSTSSQYGTYWGNIFYASDFMQLSNDAEVSFEYIENDAVAQHCRCIKD